MHYVSLDISPYDRKGKEWTGSYQVPGFNYRVVLKLKECKRQGAKIEVTKAKQAGDFQLFYYKKSMRLQEIEALALRSGFGKIANLTEAPGE